MKLSRLAVLSILLASVVALAPTAHAARPTCFGKRATKVGTSGADKLRGTPRADVIVAKGGNDEVRGRGGNDRICGGDGGDELVGGSGDDRMNEQAGSGFVGGGDGNDVIKMGAGFFNFAQPGAGDDRIVGSNLPNDLVGFGRSPQGVTVDLAAGTATGEGSDTLVNVEGAEGSDHDDSLTGTSGSNFLFGLGGNDSITTGGNAGDLDSPATIDEFRFDFITGDDGDDTLTGGPGINVVGHDTATNGVTVDLQAGTATGQGSDSLSGINVVIGSSFDDSLRGDSNPNGFEGAGGNDTVDGQNGTDVIIFEDAVSADVDLAAGGGTSTYRISGQDVTGNVTLSGIEDLWGSFGGDRLLGDDAANRIYGRAGADTLAGLDGDDVVVGEDGADTADGGAGNDTCDAETESNCEADPAPVHAARARWNILTSVLLR